MVKVDVLALLAQEDEEELEDFEIDADDDEADPDWEEVGPDGSDRESGKPVEILVEPLEKRRRTNKQKPTKDPKAEIEAQIKRLLKKTEIGRYKIALVVYVARGLQLVQVCNKSIIQNLGLSLLDLRFLHDPCPVPVRRGKRPKQSKEITDKEYVQDLIEWFSNTIAICTDEDKRMLHKERPFLINLINCFAEKEITSLIEMCVLFIACLKAARPNMPVRILNIFRYTSIEKLDFWVEVYLSEENRWLCVDLCNNKVDEPEVLNELNKPFHYLLSFDVDRSCVKPAERFYCNNWYAPAFRKERIVDERWWEAVLALHLPKHTKLDAADDLKGQDLLAGQEMPKSDNAFRSHPLYVLKKHLLKYQAIYPPDVVPLGYFKDEPVYPRECVHTCRSRETWLRQARTVKMHETPYKIVTSRPKWDRRSGEVKRGVPLEIFGHWQTEPYDPPTAQDGIVPRNAYGNVDMYQPCMLPKGCVHLHLPGLARVANKLGVDCAPAVIGFDNHCSGGSHPVMDGFIVCAEHEDALVVAWEEEQINSKKREEEKRRKIVMDNWKRLLKAAVIREKLRVKYKES